MPLVGWYERPSRQPGSITEAVLGPEESKPSPAPPPPARTREEVL
jgi:hypothetical protein